MLRVSVVSKGDYWTAFRESLITCLQDASFETDLCECMEEVDWGCRVIIVIGIHEHPDAWKWAHKKLIGVQTEQLPTDQAQLQLGRMRVNDLIARAVLPFYDLIIEWSPRGCFKT